VFEPEHIKGYLQELKKLVRKHDHSPIELVTEKLDKYACNLEKRIIDEKLRIEREIIDTIKKEMKNQEKVLKETKKENQVIKKDN
jgi:hypothetical protein